MLDMLTSTTKVLNFAPLENPRKAIPTTAHFGCSRSLKPLGGAWTLTFRTFTLGATPAPETCSRPAYTNGIPCPDCHRARPHSGQTVAHGVSYCCPCQATGSLCAQDCAGAPRTSQGNLSSKHNDERLFFEHLLRACSWALSPLQCPL